MNNDLLNTLKKLLEDAVSPQDLHLFSENGSSFEENPTHELTHVNSKTETAFRVMRKEELELFTKDALEYFYFIDKMQLLNNELKELLLDNLVQNTQITPNSIRVAILKLLSPEMSPKDLLFLDFILTTDISTTH